LQAAGRDAEAHSWFALAAQAQGEAGTLAGEPAYWRAQARRALGDEASAVSLLEALIESAGRRATEPQTTDYFATSLPTFLVFDDDLDHRNRVECRYLEALAQSGLGDRAAALAGFREVVNLDPSHTGAVLHLRDEFNQKG
jgi:tetratricopeptide (TPR) repeat protein